ncbi:hypothetical protein CUJ91_18340 [Paraburkholderia graminis]|nr:hypothetical protein CUJ91_18340 [Paraburkholderia graminis]
MCRKEVQASNQVSPNHASGRRQSIRCPSTSIGRSASICSLAGALFESTTVAVESGSLRGAKSDYPSVQHDVTGSPGDKAVLVATNEGWMHERLFKSKGG